MTKFDPTSFFNPTEKNFRPPTSSLIEPPPKKKSRSPPPFWQFDHCIDNYRPTFCHFVNKRRLDPIIIATVAFLDYTPLHCSVSIVHSQTYTYMPAHIIGPNLYKKNVFICSIQRTMHAFFVCCVIRSSKRSKTSALWQLTTFFLPNRL